MAAVTELVERLGLIERLDAAVGPIKARERGLSAGQVLVGMAAAQLCGEDFLVGLDRHRADRAGQALTPVPGLASTTAAGLARRFTDGQWAAVETGLGDVHRAALDLLEPLDPDSGHALATDVTIDMDATDVEVYGRLKQGVAFNHQGQRVGRPHVATWADTATVLAADLGSGRDDPRATAPELLGRALAALPAPARAGRIRLRADAGYFAGQLARAALFAEVEFAIGARRTAPLWRLLDSVAAEGWTDAVDMTGAQVAVTGYCPNWWPADTRLLIRRVRLDLDRGQVSGDPRARRRRTLHPEQRALPLAELASADAVFAYSFIVTNIDVSTSDKAVQVEHWYRHRTQVENLFRDTKHGTALRHLPSGHQAVNRAWMWGALLAATLTGWLHHLTATRRDGRPVGHGVRGGQAMITTLRRRLIAVPARMVRHARGLTLRLPPGDQLLAEVLARLRTLPHVS
ncbi:IS1380-like element ISCgl4 family transposase [Pseudonocardia xishanensis]|uniref:IS1380-like element ISCgl4 family transposase n=1 Tax=Pseudonocardia xishanensis TaxID=630995 RepID=A0ABP8S6E8_9PSEU